MSRKESTGFKKKRLERSFQVILGSKVSFGNPAQNIIVNFITNIFVSPLFFNFYWLFLK